ncbi:beta-glucosidase [Clavulina sp. PMI_390]|nr:beta-glucosidase [Clavulina sp. PMI_390]
MLRGSWKTSVAFLVAIPAVVEAVAVYGQCGGIGYTGSTVCDAGSTCVYSNPYYSQCLPASSTSTSTSTTQKSSSTTATTTSKTTTSTTASSSSTSASASVTPTGSWVAAVAKATAAVAKMSTQDMVNIVTGIGNEKGPCVGNLPSITSVGFTGLCLQDGPVGVRYADLVSVFPSGMNTAATFNRTLMNERGAALGAEFKGKGANVILGPDMNLMRSPRAGRNWETFGADPYLSGEAAYQTVTGIQSNGVQACAKHYINNEQELNRAAESSVVDDRTEHELYLHPFLKAVQAGVAAVMCSYNEINGTYACENSHTLNGLLKTELGFQGYVTTDWWVTEPAGTLAANAGLDMVMPGESVYGGSTSYFGPALLSAVNSGSVPLSRLQNMATRVLASWYLLGQDSGFPATNFNSWTGAGSHVNVQGTHGTLIRQIGAASTVLLKNTNNALPLVKPTTIAVIGNDAVPNSGGINSCADRGCDNGILALGWGSGTANYPYLIDPLSAITTKASSIGATVTSSSSDTDLTAAANAAAGKSVALVFISADSGEGYITVEGNVGDRNDLNAWHNGNALVAAVAAVNKNTIVVIHSVGAIVMEPWIGNANITAVVWAGIQGQEAGNSLVDILWGAVNPSGRLPFTIGKQLSDYGADIGTGSTVTYSEGLNIDYRWFDKNSITPRFEFGFGLSYTSFTYSSLSIGTPSSTGGSAPTGPGSSLSSWLHDTWLSVTFSLQNSGTVAGTEIPQLYITAPSSASAPVNQLRNFDSIPLSAGASTTVTMTLSRYSFAIWSTASQQWQIASGTYTIWVGASSRDKRLSGTLTI